MNSSINDAGESKALETDAIALEAEPSALDSEAAALEADPALAEIIRLREQIDEVDAELVGIVQRRIALSKQIQAVRMAHGGRRREHSRELKIVNTYVEGLGRGGSQLALTLLELCRGRA